MYQHALQYFQQNFGHNPENGPGSCCVHPAGLFSPGPRTQLIDDYYIGTRLCRFAFPTRPEKIRFYRVLHNILSNSIFFFIIRTRKHETVNHGYRCVCVCVYNIYRADVVLSIKYKD